MKKIHALNKIKIAGTVCLLVVVAILGIRYPDRTSASAADNMHGFLWSDMPTQSDESNQANCTNNNCGRGLGWISLNSDDPETGNVGPNHVSHQAYGVSIDFSQANMGKFSGFGWSEFGGWTDFNPSGPYPSGPGTQSVPASMLGTCLDGPFPTCAVNGWARFAAGATTPYGGFDDGWDGWVSLHGTGYGVIYHKATKTFSGMAWADSVGGWIDFSDASVIQPTVLTCQDANGVTYTYNQGDPVPAQCQPTTNYCYDANNVQYSYATGQPLPSQCTDLSCTANGQTYYYPISGPLPTECQNTPQYSTCQDSQGNIYTYPQGSPMPSQCFEILDRCNLIRGNQTGNGPWQNSNGQWYGLAGLLCMPDQCADTSDPETYGFQAIVPFTGTNGATYVVDSSDGVCKKQTSVTCTDPADCPTSPLHPIYKEN